MSIFCYVGEHHYNKDIYIYIYFFFLKTLQQGYFITPIFFYFYLKYRDINNVGRSSPQKKKM